MTTLSGAERVYFQPLDSNIQLPLLGVMREVLNPQCPDRALGNWGISLTLQGLMHRLCLRQRSDE